MGLSVQLYVLLIRSCLWVGLFALLDGFVNLALGFFEALHNFFVIQLATNVISTELPLQLAAGFTQAAFESADPQAYGTNSLRQALRSDNPEGHNAADEQFKKTDNKHTRYLSRFIESPPYLPEHVLPPGLLEDYLR